MILLLRELRPAFTLFALLTLATGVAYPLAVTGIGRMLFPEASRGSVIEREGRAIGSTLIAQPFDDPAHLWPRPSAVAYNAAASGGSNLAPTNPALIDAVNARLAALGGTAPIDVVTSSASGLDPHISPAAAEAQVARIAISRGIDATTVRAAIARHTAGRTFGILGSPRVNVLLVNLDLDGVVATKVPARESVLGWKIPGFQSER